MRPMSIRQLAAEVGLSHSAVRGKLLTRGIKSMGMEDIPIDCHPPVTDGNEYRFYDADVVVPLLLRRQYKIRSDADLQFLKDNYPSMKRRVLARKLGVSVSCITNTVRRLGLSVLIPQPFSIQETSALSPLCELVRRRRELDELIGREVENVARVTGRTPAAVLRKVKTLTTDKVPLTEEPNDGHSERPADREAGDRERHDLSVQSDAEAGRGDFLRGE